MGSMFNGATSFNQPLPAWNMSNMVIGATSFNQHLTFGIDT
jgi:hypothetical protein